MFDCKHFTNGITPYACVFLLFNMVRVACQCRSSVLNAVSYGMNTVYQSIFLSAYICIMTTFGIMNSAAKNVLTLF